MAAAGEQHGVAVVCALGRMGVELRRAVAAHDALRVTAALEPAGHAGAGSSIEDDVVVSDVPAAAFAGCDVESVGPGGRPLAGEGAPS